VAQIERELSQFDQDSEEEAKIPELIHEVSKLEDEAYSKV
jgi:hypothetical protein|tara:strand:- start:306 stop:425 length:120 start_codon:yes stop_codon:yes gene_type:complete